MSTSDDEYGLWDVAEKIYTSEVNRMMSELHWRKIRIELCVKRTFIQAGLLPDPLAHIA